MYKGIPVGVGVPDLLVDGKLLVELKTVEFMTELHRAQMISYLRAARRPLGLLINFQVPVLLRGVKRVVYTAPWPSV